MARINVVARGNYRRAQTTIRAAVEEDRLVINARQMRRAAARVCYAGDDWVRLERVR